MEFQFDVAEDTAETIAHEMMEDLSLSAVEAQEIAAKIRVELTKLARAASLAAAASREQEIRLSAAAVNRSDSFSSNVILSPTNSSTILYGQEPYRDNTPVPSSPTQATLGRPPLSRVSYEGPRDPPQRTSNVPPPFEQPRLQPVEPLNPSQPATSALSFAFNGGITVGPVIEPGPPVRSMQQSASMGATTQAPPIQRQASTNGGMSHARSGAQTPLGVHDSGRPPSIHELIQAMKDHHNQEAQERGQQEQQQQQHHQHPHSHQHHRLSQTNVPLHSLGQRQPSDLDSSSVASATAADAARIAHIASSPGLDAFSSR